MDGTHDHYDYVINMKAVCYEIMGVSVFASTATTLFQSTGRTANLQGVDSCTRGITAPGNGYYMAYSYYSNPTYTHAATAGLDGTTPTISQLIAPGATAQANSLSEPSYANAKIYASTIVNSVYKYVQDTGNGDFVVSGW